MLDISPILLRHYEAHFAKPIEGLTLEYNWPGLCEENQTEIKLPFATLEVDATEQIDFSSAWETTFLIQLHVEKVADLQTHKQNRKTLLTDAVVILLHASTVFDIGKPYRTTDQALNFVVTNRGQASSLPLREGGISQNVSTHEVRWTLQTRSTLTALE